MLNAAFVLGRLGDVAVPGVDEVTEALDLDFLGVLAAVVTEATVAFDAYDHTRALERTESAFWSFCDDYLELVKIRAYGDASEAPTRSALATLALSLSVFQRLLAPVLPFATEEAWRWWHDGSIDRAPWPGAARGRPNERAPTVPHRLLALGRPQPAGADAHPELLEALGTGARRPAAGEDGSKGIDALPCGAVHRERTRGRPGPDQARLGRPV